LIKTELDTFILTKLTWRWCTPKKPATAFKISEVNGSGQLLDQNQLPYLNGQPVTGGTVEIQGVTLQTQQTNLHQVQNLLASDVTRLVELPLDLQAGRDSNLTVQLRPKQQPTLLGTAGLKG